ncbi:MAG: hypothetical protein E6K19_08750 [Methanobacteriota archaeon]|nr:MAG: hypothetical protein E6K19_08750 [Euryarchaeota archaeon]
MGNVINMYEESRKELESNGYFTVGSSELVVVLEFAEALLGATKPGSVYRLLEVSNMLASGQWTGSFLLGWITVEEAIDAELIIHYRQQGMPPGEADAAVSRLKEWEVVSQLKARSPISLNPPDPTPFDLLLLEEFDKLRVLRNAIVHEGVPATEAYAKRMKEASTRAMWRLMRHRNLNYGTFLSKIGPLQEASRRRLDPP